MAKVFNFPLRRASTLAATRWQIWKGRAQEALGRWMNRAGLPGAVRDVNIKDSLTGQEVQVHVGPLFTRITVNGRDFYFHRTTGKYDGAGSEP